jgi:hypothetical protein
MKMLNKLVSAAAVTLAFAGYAHAGVVMNDWKFNPNGGGLTNAQTINEYLDVNGNSFIQLNKGTGNSFNFNEHSVFNITQADSNGKLFPVNYAGGNITATFEAYGTGSFNGSFTFAGGTIRIYQNPTNGMYGTSAGIYGADLGNLIATFDVLAGGGGKVDQFGNPISNGQVTVNAMANAGQITPNYFFGPDGKDLSTQSVLSFAFTNANPLQQPTQLMIDEVACQFAGMGAGCTVGDTANGRSFFLATNGEFKLAEVPEPGSLALFGIAMLGAGVVTRKRAKKA